MPTPPIQLENLAVAVQNAVQQVLAQHGAVPINKIWVGFVAPENLATIENANKVAALLGKEGGIHGAVGSVGQLAAVGEHAAGTVPKPPGHIIGIVYQPALKK
ncbi:MAG TPA: hypothetical protein VIX90_09655 [Edaphobacter sp.]